MKSALSMTGLFPLQWFDEQGYILSSRALTHGLFWLVYYVMFSLIWMRPSTGLYASFLLEFLLLPARILCVYCIIYVSMPRYLFSKRFSLFLMQYCGSLAIAATLQSLVIAYFYQPIVQDPSLALFTLSQWMKNLMLINSTVIFLGFLSLLKHHLLLLAQTQTSSNSQIEPTKIQVVADRRTHLIDIDTILYVSAMGNYIELYFNTNKRIVTYSSLKAFHKRLPNVFVRIHKSHVVNRSKVDSFNNQEVIVAGNALPRGNECDDQQLLSD